MTTTRWIKFQAPAELALVATPGYGAPPKRIRAAERLCAGRSREFPSVSAAITMRAAVSVRDVVSISSLALVDVVAVVASSSRTGLSAIPTTIDGPRDLRIRTQMFVVDNRTVCGRERGTKCWRCPPELLHDSTLRTLPEMFSFLYFLEVSNRHLPLVLRWIASPSF